MPEMAASQNVRLRYGEPRLDILLRVPLNSPDCFTDGSIPAKAASLSGDSNRVISPISARNEAASVVPTPTIVSSLQSKEANFSDMRRELSQMPASQNPDVSKQQTAALFFSTK